MSRARRSNYAENPGNILYVTGLSLTVTEEDLEEHFANRGKVTDVHVVVDPVTRENRGFGFVTMSTVAEADHCINHLNRSILNGRVILVAKARRCRRRTPTPGRYLGPRFASARYRFHHRSRNHSERDQPYSPYRRRHFYSSHYRRRAYSPCYRRYRSRTRSPSYSHHSRSIIHPRGRRSYSWDSRSYSPERSVSPYRHSHRSRRRRRRRSYTRSVSPRGR